MRLLVSLALPFAAFFLGGCQTYPTETIKPSKVEVTGAIEVTSYEIEKTSNNLCLIVGKLIDENGDGLVGMKAELYETGVGAICDLDGRFEIKQVPPGSYTIILSRIGEGSYTIQIDLEAGDQLNLEASLGIHVTEELLKPIIYLYPEQSIEVNVKLDYDGELTATYPKYPEKGWSVNANPDGTLFDEKGREYYSLYWEGTPRHPLTIPTGFIVPKEETIPFLEEKLALLGLSPREANEFIIFWLPILEKNTFNVIHFAEEDYLEQAQLTVSPKPETIIRIAMVFQGLDEPIDIPIQDLTSLKKTRKGFTLVEWGGQELSKAYNLATK